MIDWAPHVARVLDTFGVPLQWIPAGEPARTLHAKFANPHLLVTAGSVDVSSTNPTAYCKTADCVGMRTGDELVRGDETFVVVDLQPGDDGMTTIVLGNRQAYS